MRSLTILCLAAVLVAYSVTMAAAEVTEVEMNRIRCKVCDRAIAHIWNQGATLRKHCKLHNTDPRCDNTNLRKSAIDEMVREVCDDLPKSHQALITDEDFELFSHESPKHEPEVIAAITESCKKWVHDINTVQAVTRYMYANLDAGKNAHAILHPLQRRFCRSACTPDKPSASKSLDAEL